MNTHESFKSLLDTCASLYKKKKVYITFFYPFQKENIFSSFSRSQRENFEMDPTYGSSKFVHFHAIAFFVQDKQPTKLSCR